MPLMGINVLPQLDRVSQLKVDICKYILPRVVWALKNSDRDWSLSALEQGSFTHLWFWYFSYSLHSCSQFHAPWSILFLKSQSDDKYSVLCIVLRDWCKGSAVISDRRVELLPDPKISHLLHFLIKHRSLGTSITLCFTPLGLFIPV